MTRHVGLTLALCIVACGKEGGGDGSEESTSTSTGGEESSTSSTTMVMTTMPPTSTTATTAPPDTGESSTGEPECEDPFTMGELDRHDLYQLEEGADTIFTDIGVILGDRYIAGSAAQVAGEPRLATFYIIDPLNGIQEALLGEGMDDVEVDRLAIAPSGMASRMITQIDGTTVEVRDPGDFFNVAGTYQEMGARTRLRDAVMLDDTTIWGVGQAEGMMASYGLVAQSTDGGATWMMSSTFELGADLAAEATGVAYHAGANALVISALAADAELVLNWHVRAGTVGSGMTEELETIPEGNARAVEVVGDEIYVAGDVQGVWHIRRTSAIGVDFEPFDVGGGFTAMKSTVVDLAAGPNGELFALGTVDTKEGQTLMTLRMCADPSLGSDCWQTIIEPEQRFVGESTFPRRMMADEEGAWIVGSVVDIDEELGNEGALFRLGCPE